MVTHRLTNELNNPTMTLKKPNTKAHWTALAIARFYEQHGTAVRARDLWPFVKDIHGEPDRLVATLGKLNDKDVVDHIVVMSPTRNGGSGKTYAYYPTPITIETLRDLGEPTELPDHSPIPDGVDTSTPTDRIGADDEVPPPEDVSSPGLEYAHAGGKPGGEAARDYDTTGIEEEPEAEILPDGDTDELVEDDDDVEDVEEVEEWPCEGCGKTFDNPHGYGGHIARCDEYQALDEPDEDVEDEEDEHACPNCGAEFDSGKALGGHLTHCKPEPEGATEEDVADALEDVSEGPEPELVSFDDGDGLDTSTTPSKPGQLARSVDWMQVARDLESRAQKAADAGLLDIASAYSQFASMAVEERLDRRTAFILLGTPVLELEKGDVSMTAI